MEDSDQGKIAHVLNSPGSQVDPDGCHEEWVTRRRCLTMEKEWSGKETGLRQITEDLRHYLVFL